MTDTPERETVTAKLCITSCGKSFHMEPHFLRGHYGDDDFYFTLTFDIIDGKPDPASIKPEPKLETVTLYGGEQCLWDFYGRAAGVMHKTHKITFDIIDGKPDPASIKMEML